MRKNIALKPKEVEKLLKIAKPVITIFSAISSLQKKITEKEKNIKREKGTVEELKKLKTELKNEERKLKKMGEKRLAESSEAIRLLLYHNQNFVKYLAKGYHSFGG